MEKHPFIYALGFLSHGAKKGRATVLLIALLFFHGAIEELDGHEE